MRQICESENKLFNGEEEQKLSVILRNCFRSWRLLDASQKAFSDVVMERNFASQKLKLLDFQLCMFYPPLLFEVSLIPLLRASYAADIVIYISAFFSGYFMIVIKSCVGKTQSH